MINSAVKKQDTDCYHTSHGDEFVNCFFDITGYDKTLAIKEAISIFNESECASKRMIITVNGRFADISDPMPRVCITVKRSANFELPNITIVDHKDSDITEHIKSIIDIRKTVFGDCPIEIKALTNDDCYEDESESYGFKQSIFVSAFPEKGRIKGMKRLPK